MCDFRIKITVSFFFSLLEEAQITRPPVTVPPPVVEECEDGTVDIPVPEIFPSGKECFVYLPDKPAIVTQPNGVITIQYKICCSTTCGTFNFFPHFYWF